MPVIKPRGHQRRETEAEGWPIGITSFQLGNDWVCHVDNVSPGAVIARSRGATREEAEAAALSTAAARLRTTRRIKRTLADLKVSVASMDATLPKSQR